MKTTEAPNDLDKSIMTQEISSASMIYPQVSQHASTVSNHKENDVDDTSNSDNENMEDTTGLLIHSDGSANSEITLSPVILLSKTISNDKIVTSGESVVGNFSKETSFDELSTVLPQSLQHVITDSNREDNSVDDTSKSDNGNVSSISGLAGHLEGSTGSDFITTPGIPLSTKNMTRDLRILSEEYPGDKQSTITFKTYSTSNPEIRKLSSTKPHTPQTLHVDTKGESNAVDESSKIEAQNIAVNTVIPILYDESISTYAFTIIPSTSNPVDDNKEKINIQNPSSDSVTFDSNILSGDVADENQSNFPLEIYSSSDYSSEVSSTIMAATLKPAVVDNNQETDSVAVTSTLGIENVAATSGTSELTEDSGVSLAESSSSPAVSPDSETVVSNELSGDVAAEYQSTVGSDSYSSDDFSFVESTTVIPATTQPAEVDSNQESTAVQESVLLEVSTVTSSSVSTDHPEELNLSLESSSVTPSPSTDSLKSDSSNVPVDTAVENESTASVDDSSSSHSTIEESSTVIPTTLQPVVVDNNLGTDSANVAGTLVSENVAATSGTSELTEDSGVSLAESSSSPAVSPDSETVVSNELSGDVAAEYQSTVSSDSYSSDDFSFVESTTVIPATTQPAEVDSNQESTAVQESVLLDVSTVTSSSVSTEYPEELNLSLESSSDTPSPSTDSLKSDSSNVPVDTAVENESTASVDDSSSSHSTIEESSTVIPTTLQPVVVDNNLGTDSANVAGTLVSENVAATSGTSELTEDSGVSLAESSSSPAVSPDSETVVSNELSGDVAAEYQSTVSSDSYSSDDFSFVESTTVIPATTQPAEVDSNQESTAVQESVLLDVSTVTSSFVSTEYPEELNLSLESSSVTPSPSTDSLKSDSSNVPVDTAVESQSTASVDESSSSHSTIEESSTVIPTTLQPVVVDNNLGTDSANVAGTLVSENVAATSGTSELTEDSGVSLAESSSSPAVSPDSETVVSNELSGDVAAEYQSTVSSDSYSSDDFSFVESTTVIPATTQPAEVDSNQESTAVQESVLLEVSTVTSSSVSTDHPEELNLSLESSSVTPSPSTDSLKSDSSNVPVDTAVENESTASVDDSSSSHSTIEESSTVIPTTLQPVVVDNNLGTDSANVAGTLVSENVAATSGTSELTEDSGVSLAESSSSPAVSPDSETVVSNELSGDVAAEYQSTVSSDSYSSDDFSFVESTTVIPATTQPAEVDSNQESTAVQESVLLDVSTVTSSFVSTEYPEELNLSLESSSVTPSPSTDSLKSDSSNVPVDTAVESQSTASVDESSSSHSTIEESSTVIPTTLQPVVVDNNLGTDSANVAGTLVSENVAATSGTSELTEDSGVSLAESSSSPAVSPDSETVVSNELSGDVAAEYQSTVSSDSYSSDDFSFVESTTVIPATTQPAEVDSNQESTAVQESVLLDVSTVASSSASTDHPEELNVSPEISSATHSPSTDSLKSDSSNVPVDTAVESQSTASVDESLSSHFSIEESSTVIPTTLQPVVVDNNLGTDSANVAGTLVSENVAATSGTSELTEDSGVSLAESSSSPAVSPDSETVVSNELSGDVAAEYQSTVSSDSYSSDDFSFVESTTVIPATTQPAEVDNNQESTAVQESVLLDVSTVASSSASTDHPEELNVSPEISSVTPSPSTDSLKSDSSNVPVDTAVESQSTASVDESSSSHSTIEESSTVIPTTLQPVVVDNNLGTDSANVAGTLVSEIIAATSGTSELTEDSGVSLAESSSSPAVSPDSETVVSNELSGDVAAEYQSTVSSNSYSSDDFSFVESTTVIPATTQPAEVDSNQESTAVQESVLLDVSTVTSSSVSTEYPEELNLSLESSSVTPSPSTDSLKSDSSNVPVDTAVESQSTASVDDSSSSHSTIEESSTVIPTTLQPVVVDNNLGTDSANVAGTLVSENVAATSGTSELTEDSGVSLAESSSSPAVSPDSETVVSNELSGDVAAEYQSTVSSDSYSSDDFSFVESTTVIPATTQPAEVDSNQESTAVQESVLLDVSTVTSSSVSTEYPEELNLSLESSSDTPSPSTDSSKSDSSNVPVDTAVENESTASVDDSSSSHSTIEESSTVIPTTLQPVVVDNNLGTDSANVAGTLVSENVAATSGTSELTEDSGVSLAESSSSPAVSPDSETVVSNELSGDVAAEYQSTVSSDSYSSDDFSFVESTTVIPATTQPAEVDSNQESTAVQESVLLDVSTVASSSASTDHPEELNVSPEISSATHSPSTDSLKSDSSNVPVDTAVESQSTASVDESLSSHFSIEESSTVIPTTLQPVVVDNNLGTDSANVAGTLVSENVAATSGTSELTEDSGVSLAESSSSPAVSPDSETVVSNELSGDVAAEYQSTVSSNSYSSDDFSFVESTTVIPATTQPAEVDSNQESTAVQESVLLDVSTVASSSASTDHPEELNVSPEISSATHSPSTDSLKSDSSNVPVDTAVESQSTASVDESSSSHSTIEESSTVIPTTLQPVVVDNNLGTDSANVAGTLVSENVAATSGTSELTEDSGVSLAESSSSPAVSPDSETVVSNELSGDVAAEYQSTVSSNSYSSDDFSFVESTTVIPATTQPAEVDSNQESTAVQESVLLDVSTVTSSSVSTEYPEELNLSLESSSVTPSPSTDSLKSDSSNVPVDTAVESQSTASVDDSSSSHSTIEESSTVIPTTLQPVVVDNNLGTDSANVAGTLVSENVAATSGTSELTEDSGVSLAESSSSPAVSPDSETVVSNELSGDVAAEYQSTVSSDSYSSDDFSFVESTTVIPATTQPAEVDSNQESTAVQESVLLDVSTVASSSASTDHPEELNVSPEISSATHSPSTDSSKSDSSNVPVDTAVESQSTASVDESLSSHFSIEESSTVIPTTLQPVVVDNNLGTDSANVAGTLVSENVAATSGTSELTEDSGVSLAESSSSPAVSPDSETVVSNELSGDVAAEYQSTVSSNSYSSDDFSFVESTTVIPATTQPAEVDSNQESTAVQESVLLDVSTVTSSSVSTEYPEELNLSLESSSVTPSPSTDSLKSDSSNVPVDTAVESQSTASVDDSSSNLFSIEESSTVIPTTLQPVVVDNNLGTDSANVAGTLVSEIIAATSGTSELTEDSGVSLAESSSSPAVSPDSETVVSNELSGDVAAEYQSTVSSNSYSSDDFSFVESTTVIPATTQPAEVDSNQESTAVQESVLLDVSTVTSSSVSTEYPEELNLSLESSSVTPSPSTDSLKSDSSNVPVDTAVESQSTASVDESSSSHSTIEESSTVIPTTLQPVVVDNNLGTDSANVAGTLVSENVAATSGTSELTEDSGVSLAESSSSPAVSPDSETVVSNELSGDVAAEYQSTVSSNSYSSDDFSFVESTTVIPATTQPAEVDSNQESTAVQESVLLDVSTVTSSSVSTEYPEELNLSLESSSVTPSPSTDSLKSDSSNVPVDTAVESQSTASVDDSSSNLFSIEESSTVIPTTLQPVVVDNNLGTDSANVAGTLVSENVAATSGTSELTEDSGVSLAESSSSPAVSPDSETVVSNEFSGDVAAEYQSTVSSDSYSSDDFSFVESTTVIPATTQPAEVDSNQESTAVQESVLLDVSTVTSSSVSTEYPEELNLSLESSSDTPSPSTDSLKSDSSNVPVDTAVESQSTASVDESLSSHFSIEESSTVKATTLQPVVVDNNQGTGSADVASTFGGENVGATSGTSNHTVDSVVSLAESSSTPAVSSYSTVVVSNVFSGNVAAESPSTVSSEKHSMLDVGSLVSTIVIPATTQPVEFEMIRESTTVHYSSVLDIASAATTFAISDHTDDSILSVTSTYAPSKSPDSFISVSSVLSSAATEPTLTVDSYSSSAASDVDASAILPATEHSGASVTTDIPHISTTESGTVYMVCVFLLFLCLSVFFSFMVCNFFFKFFLSF